MAAATSGLVSTERAGDQRLIGGIALLRGAAAGLGLGDRRLRLASFDCGGDEGVAEAGQLFLADEAVAGEMLAPVEVGPGLGDRRLGGDELGARLADVGVAGADLRGERAAGARRLHILAPRLEIGRLGLFEREARRRCRRGAASTSPLRTYCVLTTGTSTTAAATSGVTCALSAPT